MSQIKNLVGLKYELATNQSLQNEFKNDPVKAIEKISKEEGIPDTWIYRIVVGSLGMAIILVIIGVVLLTINSSEADKSVPTVLTAISSGAIGALAGLLAPSPARQNQ